MSVTPYSYTAYVIELPPFTYLVPVGAETKVNTGSSGGSYEAVPGWRVVIRNRGAGKLLLTAGTTQGVPSFPVTQFSGTPGNTTEPLWVIEPGETTEYGISPQAAEGLTADGAGLGQIFTALVSLDLPVTVEITQAQTDPAPDLSY
jgi:hypothetical protein